MDWSTIEMHKDNWCLKGWVTELPDPNKIIILLEYPGTTTGIFVILDSTCFNPYPSELQECRYLEYTNDFFCLLRAENQINRK